MWSHTAPAFFFVAFCPFHCDASARIRVKYEKCKKKRNTMNERELDFHICIHRALNETQSDCIGRYLCFSAPRDHKSNTSYLPFSYICVPIPEHGTAYSQIPIYAALERHDVHFLLAILNGFMWYECRFGRVVIQEMILHRIAYSVSIMFIKERTTQFLFSLGINQYIAIFKYLYIDKTN